MVNYNVDISDVFYRDLDDIIELKEEFGAYKSNIDNFKKEIEARLLKLRTSPMIGADLSARVKRETNKKYFVIDKYLMIYEITGEKEVSVSRILSAKSNWQRMLF